MALSGRAERRIVVLGGRSGFVGVIMGLAPLFEDAID